MSLKCEAAHPLQCTLSISIPLYDADYNSNQATVFLSQMIPLNFSSVTKLRFTTTQPLYSRFGSFFGRLHSVDTIFVDSKTLSFLANLQFNIKKTATKGNIIFPVQKVISLAVDLRYPAQTPSFQPCRWILPLVEDANGSSHYHLGYVKQCTFFPVTKS